MKKIVIVSVVLGLGLLVGPVWAEEMSNKSSEMPHMDKDKSEMGQMVNINPAGRTNLRGTLDSVGSNSLTVKSWGGNWTVNLVSTTKLVRRFGGSSSLSEFQKGDVVEVQGRAETNAVWTINAEGVKDFSIQMKGANFSGTISNLSGGSFSLATKERGTVQVTFKADARVMVNGKAGVAADLANGMQAMVSGVWDRKQSTVLAEKVQAKTPGLQKMSVRGTISNLSGNSFTLSANSGTFQVTINSGSKINVDGKEANASALANGMTVMAAGTGNKTTLTLAAERIEARTKSGKNHDGQKERGQKEQEQKGQQ